MTAVWIDVHAHYTPPMTEDQREAAWHSQREACFLAPQPYLWTPELALAEMDRAGTTMQLLSYLPRTIEALRASNEYGASLVRRHPDRFGLLLALPTDDLDAAMAEVTRAEELGADGFAVTCCRNGVYLGNPSLRPLWAELDRRGAVVFAHPDAYAPGAQGRPAPLLEVGFETTRTIVDMLYAGIFRDYPNVRLIVAHCGGGGALPAMSGRLELLGAESWVPNPNAVTRTEIRQQLARLYLDTAATGLPSSLAAALTMIPPSHLLYGSDSGVPCSTPETIDINRQALLNFPGLPPEQREDVGRNALQLFPGAAARLGKAGKASRNTASTGPDSDTCPTPPWPHR
ncbi:amidohydrolase [Nocardia sp. NEAU-G5]|uniref:Amidohydrolase n=1 Tax=Nocardia albiluteola TaxID=2842303 RepID=A0ABS6B3B6_9NOCA|nr:amidohydrolase family protein [Nocardia albiluteola]MBU3064789.1 amidohydrolase [Nocardia albiluteola]